MAAGAALDWVLESTSDVVWVFGPDGTCRWVSPSVRTVLGFEPGDLVGTRVTVLHPEDRAEALERYAAALARRATHLRSRFRVLGASGAVLWVDASTDLWWSPGGLLERSVTSMRDVTAQMEAERLLAASEERYRLLMENTSDAVFSATPDAVFTWVSPSVERLLGWTPDQVVGRRPGDLVHPDDQGPLAANVATVGTGGAVSLRLRFRTATGDHRWLQATVRAVFDDAGAVIGRVGSFRDVDEETRAHLLLTGVFASAVEPHVLLRAVRDDDGEVVDFAYVEANYAAVDYMRTTRDALVGTRVRDLYPEPAASQTVAMYASVLDATAPLVLDEWAYPGQAPGRERFYDVRGVGVGEDIVSFSWRDVTERRRMLAELADSREQYRLLAENASDLVAMADNDGRLQWFSDSIAAYGWDPSEVVGHHASEFIHPDDRHLLREVGEVTGRGETARVEWRIAEHDDPNRWHWFRVHMNPVRDDSGRVVGRISGWQNIDAEVAARATVEAERRRLRATMDSLMDPHALLSPVCDDAGRLVDLRVVDANLQAHAETGQAPAGMHGVSVREVSPPPIADAVLSWCAAALARGGPVAFDATPIHGLGDWDTTWADVRVVPVDGLLSVTWRNVSDRQREHQQVVDAEERARTRLDVFEPGLADVDADPERLRTLVSGCLDRGGPAIALQPIIDMTTGDPVGFEALARFGCNDLGGPDAWFTAAHRIGLGAELEAAAVTRALELIPALPPECFLSVNVSPALVTSGLLTIDLGPWRRLVLELTEHVPVTDYAVINAALNPLRHRGARLAVDDTGAGFASLRHILDLRPDVIKLDIGLVRGIDTDIGRSSLAGMMLDLGTRIDAIVIAEGVETQTEHDTLSQLGFTWAQGYLHGKPTLAT